MNQQYANMLREASECRQCRLCETRKRVVLPEGPCTARYMIVSDRPDRLADEHGRPFVKGSGTGDFFDAILRAAGAAREEFVITNAIMCRPPPPPRGAPRGKDDDVPKWAMNACRRWLLGFVYLVDPVVIFAMGAHAIEALTGHSVNVVDAYGKVALMTHPGKVQPYQIPVVVLANPAWVDKMNDARHPEGHAHHQVYGMIKNLVDGDRIRNMLFGDPIPTRGQIAIPRNERLIPRVRPDEGVNDQPGGVPESAQSGEEVQEEVPVLDEDGEDLED